MKKLLLSFAAILFLVGYAGAYDTVPQGRSGDVASSDYYGVDYSTISFSSASVLCFTGPGVFQGLIVSSFSVTDPIAQIIIRDTGTVTGSHNLGASNTLTDYNTHAGIADVWISSTALNLSVFVSTPIGGGFDFMYKPPHPLRVKQGLVIKASVATLARITALWTEFK